jgi:hypothetical protein
MMYRGLISRFFSAFPLPATVYSAVPVRSTGAHRIFPKSPSKLVFFQGLVIAALLCSSAAEAKPGGKGGGKSPADVYTPMSLDLENYYFRVPGENACLGEDDELEWNATGSLKPGESFSFTPMYAGCNAHPAAITVVSSWRDGKLELSSIVPDTDYTSWDADQLGQTIQAPQVGNSAQLCMFPAYSSEGVNYTITLTNNSSETVHGISLHGRHENDWSIFYYPRCLNADADGDGWNDSLEHSMANLVYPNGFLDGVFQPDILWGSNYLRGHAQTPFADDEIDSYPLDFNDDGWVDDNDLSILDNQLAQGNGIALEQISPNPGVHWYHENTLPWRRYDLDGDGYVDQGDREIILQILDSNIISDEDVISPTARILAPEDGSTIAKGQYLKIESHVWDNAALARVDYVVNGKTICSVTNPTPTFGFTSPLYQCWWNVPKRRSSYQIQVRVYDATGNVGASQSVLVVTN